MYASVIIVRLYVNHKLLNNKIIEKDNPVILLKNILPIEYAKTIVKEPKMGEKNLAADSSVFVGIFSPGSG